MTITGLGEVLVLAGTAVSDGVYQAALSTT
jgi:hypothetical protein